MTNSCDGFLGSFSGGCPPGGSFGPDFQYQISNLDGVTPSAQPGADVNVGGGNADGATLPVLSAVASELQYLIIGIAAVNTTGEDNSALFDILIDPAGGVAWQAFINDVVGGSTPATTTSIGMTVWYHFPVRVPAGASIGAHGRKNGATGVTAKMIVYGFGDPSRPGQWWFGSGVETLGAIPATSKGQTVVPANGAFGLFATLGTSTRRYRAIQYGFQFDGAGFGTQSTLVQLGIGGSPIAGVPSYQLTQNTIETAPRAGMVMPILREFEAGTTFQGRGFCSGAVTNMNACVYGVYD